jgi:uncharacterized protein YkwD
VLYDQHTKDYTKTRQQYRDLATRNQANPDNVTLDYTSTAQKPTGPVTQQKVDEELARVNAKRAAAGLPPVTRDQVLQSYQRRGIEVR